MWVLKTYAFCKGPNSQKPIHFTKGFQNPTSLCLQEAGCDPSLKFEPGYTSMIRHSSRSPSSSYRAPSRWNWERSLDTHGSCVVRLWGRLPSKSRALKYRKPGVFKISFVSAHRLTGYKSHRLLTVPISSQSILKQLAGIHFMRNVHKNGFPARWLLLDIDLPIQFCGGTFDDAIWG